MSNDVSSLDPPKLRLSCPADVLAAIPYVVGFHPTDSLVVLAMGGERGRLKFSARLDLPTAGDTDIHTYATYVADVVSSQRGVTEAMLIAYGSADAADTLVVGVTEALAHAGVPVRESLRTHDGRYWSYCCADPRCCPPEGVPYDVTSNAVAATATLAGCVAFPDRASLRKSVAPLDGVTRASMAQATSRAEARLTRWAGEASAPVFRERLADEGRRALHDALDRYGAGNASMTHDEIAWFGLLLKQLVVRDEAWLLVNDENRASHLALWSDLVRHVETPYVPAPASLLAFTAWQDGNGALAWIAIDRARQAAPDYSMAQLIADALARGVPPSSWQPAMTPDELHTRYRGQR